MKTLAASPSKPTAPPPAWRGPLLCLLCLVAALLIPFHRSLESAYVLFANDGPLGTLKSDTWAMPAAMGGIWVDGYLLGSNGGVFVVSPLAFFLMVLGPVGFAKFMVPLGLLALGLSAALFVRTLGARWSICTLVGLAAALNTNFFSNGAWGLPGRATSLAANFLAMAVLSGLRGRPLWLRLPLAGLLVGAGLIEGADNGAIFSLYFSAFALCHAWQEVQGSAVRKLTLGGARVAVVAVFAGLMAFQTIQTLVGTQIKGIAGMEKKTAANPADPAAATQLEAERKADAKRKWDFATQWSLSKAELLRVIIPGVFGYRMDTPNGGNYWGRVGQKPGWDEHHQGEPRSSGAGEYAGVLVVFIGIWAVIQAFRRQDTPFTPTERNFIRFWLVALILSVLFAVGYHAPFYRLIYPLPFFSTIRNPMKFMHPGHMALMILFAYGLIGLYRRHIENAAATTRGLVEHLAHFWTKANPFDKRWVAGTVGVAAVTFLGWLFFASSGSGVEWYRRQVQAAGFSPEMAQSIAGFSLKEVGLFAFFLGLSVLAVAVVVSNWLAGSRARWAGPLLGVLLVIDLCRADLPWVVYQNYQEKYATNPVFEVLRDRPYEHRVTMPPPIPSEVAIWQSMYIEWLRDNFQYYNIQTLDVNQMPRVPEDYAQYLAKLQRVPFRYWQLTNTRYFLTLTQFVDPVFNRQLDPEKRRFRLHSAYSLAPRAGVPQKAGYTQDDLTLVPQTNGPLAIMEFTAALPRARFYDHWEAGVADTNALETLVSPAFNPLATVLVADSLPAPAAGPATNASPGTVEFSSYESRRIRLKVQAGTAGVVLLNDKFDPDWRVTVDGKPEKLLRCNFIMRGVQVPAGTHEVEFRFAPAVKNRGIAVTAWILLAGLALLLVLPVRPPTPATPAPAPTPDAKPKANPKK